MASSLVLVFLPFPFRKEGPQLILTYADGVREARSWWPAVRWPQHGDLVCVCVCCVWADFTMGFFSKLNGIPEPPEGYVPPLGSSRETWTNIYKNKGRIDYCVQQFGVRSPTNSLAHSCLRTVGA